MLEKLVNVVIDWFKFSINTSFNRNNKIVIDLFKILKLDIDIYDEETSTGQFEKRLVYDEQTIVLAKPRMDKNVKREGVDDYFFIDLSGQACRDFEQRGGIWKDLFIFISKQSFH